MLRIRQIFIDLFLETFFQYTYGAIIVPNELMGKNATEMKTEFAQICPVCIAMTETLHRVNGFLRLVFCQLIQKIGTNIGLF